MYLRVKRIIFLSSNIFFFFSPNRCSHVLLSDFIQSFIKEILSSIERLDKIKERPFNLKFIIIDRNGRRQRNDEKHSYKLEKPKGNGYLPMKSG